jgi:DNA-binding CsgD family transcriptional regulator/tetratricopeptide (TPR) repeat protein
VGQCGTGQARPVPLIGREAELGRLIAASRAARAGHGTMVLISGEPGIGKTALLASLAERAAADGARVAIGAAEELQQQVPFAAIADCLGLTADAADQGAAEIAALLRGSYRPSGGTFPAADAEFLIAEAILGLVDEWCTAGPVLLAVDDLQWADPASLLILHQLGRIASQLPLLIAATRRSGAGGTDLPASQRGAVVPGPRSEERGTSEGATREGAASQASRRRAGITPDRLVRSWEARDAEEVPLGPLDEYSVATLIAQVAGPGSVSELFGQITTAAGNPLYVIELARTLVGRALPGIAGGTGPDPAAGAVAEPLLHVVTRRLTGLPDQTREILQLAAVLGAWFTVPELSAMLAAPPVELLAVVQEAVAAAVLVADADRLVFQHEVIRQALQESWPVSARDALHQRAGQALVAVGAPAERAAPHLLAGMTFDLRALRWLAGSADRLSARAPALATELLHRALDGTDPPGDQAGPLRLALASALLRAGRFAAAETAADAALTADWPGGAAGRLHWILVQARLSRGHVTEALAEAQRALDGDGLTHAERARFHGLAAQCLHVLPWTRPEAAMRAAEGARHEGMAGGDPYARAYGLHAVAEATRWQGRFSQALEEAGQAAQALDQAGPIIDSQLAPHLIRADCLFDLDRDAEAQRAYAAGLRLAERGIGTFSLCLHHLSVARGYFLAGRWDDALSEIGSAREVPDHLGAAVHLDGLATLIAVHRQDREELARLRAALDEPLASGTIRHTIDDRSWGRALAALADDDQETAFRVLSSAWQECVAGHREYCGHYLLPDLAGLAVSLGEPETAWQAVAQLDRYTADRDGPALRRSARFATAILDGDAAALDRVAEAYAIAGRPLLEALAREHAAELLAAAGRLPVARQQLDAAQDCYARLDAVWDAARADARLRAHGIRRATQDPRRRPTSGWESLTETERKVAALLADGLSAPDIASRMFTSRRTVQHHVSSILAKLGLSSRVELATLIARRAS